MQLDIAAVALERGDKHGAGRAYRAAFRFQPDLAWRDDMPEAGKGLFEAAALAIYMNPPSELSFVPEVPEGLRFDGQRAEVFEGEVEIPAGPHILQFGVDSPATLGVDLPSGKATMTVPAVPEGALGLLSTEERRQELDEKLRWTADAGSVVWLAQGDELWRHKLGTDVWTERWAPVVDRSNAVQKRVRLGSAVGLGGAGLAVVGGALTALFYASTTRAASGVEASFDDTELVAAQSKYRSENGKLGASRILVGVGAATAVAGFSFTLGRADLQRDLVQPTTDGGE